ncbi:MAG: 50S ribosomal protein L18 [Eubacteriaceae bacterium]|jgi:large subunit ribosomal protein L18|nr:50S ribosomal protein L18 [Eubacteriaceae bacterium]
MIKKLEKNKERRKRHYRVRNKINGTPQRPRLNVFRSNKHIYAQIIDDISRMTLVAASTAEKEIADQIAGATKKEAAKAVGKAVAQKALEKGIETVVFDRSGYVYHGRVKELADGAREAGLNF